METFFFLKAIPPGILQPLVWDEFQQDRNCMKCHSHLPQGPAKTESIRKKKKLLHSCEKVPGWPEKGIAVFLDTDFCHMCRTFKEAGLNEAGGFFKVRAAFTLVQLSGQMSNILSAIWSLLPTLFHSLKDPGRSA